jgi:hypothetical protein
MSSVVIFVIFWNEKNFEERKKQLIKIICRFVDAFHAFDGLHSL